MVAIAEHSKACCAGFLMKKEWEYLAEALKAPERPYVAVSGGAKVSTKVAVLDNLLESVDHVIIGGAMANTFFLAQGHGVGKSLVEEDAVATAKEIMTKAEAKGVKLHLPVDCVLGDDFKEGKALKTVPVDQVDPELMILDIGPESVKTFREVVMAAKTVVWNGPMGAFENPAFAEGSKGVATALAESPALTIMGGGDTGPILKLTGLTDKIDFLSTGGGSFLEFMEGKELPAFTALQKCGS
jgi:phosphoglycerate kinase